MSSEKTGTGLSTGHTEGGRDVACPDCGGFDFSLAPEACTEDAVSHVAPDIEGYEMLGVLSDAGAQGVVWRARQKGTDRHVAVKVFAPAMGRSSVGLVRFEREVRLAARLDHPNVARVYQSGVVDGCPWYSMELVEGTPLDEYAEACALNHAERVELMTRVCRAIQHAHERGIIHRDLKPSNVLVTDQGQPRVLDFGLARTLEDSDADVLVSQEGQPLGNLLHMAPEQARGESDEVSTRTDVYGLGIMLYRLVTGGEPRDLGNSYYEALRRVAEQEVTPPRRINPRLSRELETVLLKATESEPDRRYATAGQFADDLENYLRGDPIQARPQTFVYVVRKKLWKHRTASIAAAAALVLLCVGVVFYIQSIRAERRRTEQARQQAVAAARTARQNALRASTQRALALRVLDRVVFDIQEELSHEMGQTRLREQLLDTAVAGLREIAERSSDYDAPADRSAAAAAMQIGDTLIAVGRMQDGVSAYREALEQFTSLLAENPNNQNLMHDVCVVRSRLASALLRMGQPEQAAEAVRPAGVVADRLEATAADRVMALRNRWALETVRGDVESARGKRRGAVACYRAAVKAAEALVVAASDDRGLGDLSLALKRLGDGLLAVDELTAAEAAYRRALEMDRRRVGGEPPSFRSRRDLAAGLAKLAECLHAQGDHADAAGLVGRAVELHEDLKRDDPDRLSGSADLAASLYLQARIGLAEGRDGLARKSLQRAAELLDALTEAGHLEAQPDWRSLRQAVMEELDRLKVSGEGGRP
jgi:non-specific serine/threonine protein kinase/serine/threonine-protein kinase